MKKLMTAAGVAVLSLSLAALGYAAQTHDPGDSSSKVSPSAPDSANPNMSGDRGSQRDTMGSDRGGRPEGDSGKKEGKKEGKKDRKSPSPPVAEEGSNPSLDKAGKGSAGGG